MLCVAVVGEDWMLSAVLQVVLQITNPPSKSPPIHLIVIPTCESHLKLLFLVKMKGSRGHGKQRS